MVNWQPIIDKVNEHGYMSGVDRMSDRVKNTGEIFTPTTMVIKMIEKSGIDNYGLGKTVLDPACGDGQMLVSAKWLKVLHFGMTEENALKDIYGVDIMRDNVDLCKKRLGGGNILMGNTLDPYTKLEEQTEYEHQKMIELFGGATLPI
jgi:2-polyprenyl-3-methyl-5-hydroxy-6-metoxy-1,4-benzoquinol methylase